MLSFKYFILETERLIFFFFYYFMFSRRSSGGNKKVRIQLSLHSLSSICLFIFSILGVFVIFCLTYKCFFTGAFLINIHFFFYCWKDMNVFLNMMKKYYNVILLKNTIHIQASIITSWQPGTEDILWGFSRSLKYFHVPLAQLSLTLHFSGRNIYKQQFCFPWS